MLIGGDDIITFGTCFHVFFYVCFIRADWWKSDRSADRGIGGGIQIS